jgi:flagellar basal-body rod protein FlgB
VIRPADTGLEFYRQVLELRSYRQQILTADIANASTPGFKAVDLDFREALRAVSASPGDDLPQAAAAAVKYQVGMPVTLDGNSVDLNQEKAVAAENAVQYEAAAGFAAQTIKMLTIAINGSGAQQSGGA